MRRARRAAYRYESRCVSDITTSRVVVAAALATSIVDKLSRLSRLSGQSSGKQTPHRSTACTANQMQAPTTADKCGLATTEDASSYLANLDASAVVSYHCSSLCRHQQAANT